MKIKVISVQKKAAVIEYFADGVKQRCIIPEESLENGNTVRDELLSASIPYGVDWESQLEGVIGNVTSGMVAEEFHKAGLWTAEDVMADSRKVEGVLRAIYSFDLAGIISIAKNMMKK